MEILLGLFIILLLIFGILYFVFQILKLRLDRLYKSVTSFDSYAAVLEYHMNRAYKLIYKDRLLTYSLEGMKVSEKEFSTVVKDYVNLVIKMIGPTLLSEFTFIYGSEQTFFLNVIEYFNSKYEEDEIQKTQADKLMEGDDNSITKIFE